MSFDDGMNEVRERFAFESWRTPDLGGESVFVWQLALDGSELDEWTLVATQSVADGTGHDVVYSTWTNRSNPELGIRIDIYTAASRDASRRDLLHRLSSTQVPTIEQLAPDSVGDVAFGEENNNLVIFAQGNLVIEVATLGSFDIDAVAIAREFTQAVLAKPDETDTQTTDASTARFGASESLPPSMATASDPTAAADPLLPRAPLMTVGPGPGALETATALPPTVPVATNRGVVRSDDPSAGALAPTLQFFATRGEVKCEAGQLLFVANEDGEQTVEMYEREPGQPPRVSRRWTSADG